MQACDGQTDGQTDGRTEGQTEFSSLDRVCIPCSAVKNLETIHVFNTFIQTCQMQTDDARY